MRVFCIIDELLFDIPVSGIMLHDTRHCKGFLLPDDSAVRRKKKAEKEPFEKIFFGGGKLATLVGPLPCVLVEQD